MYHFNLIRTSDIYPLPIFRPLNEGESLEDEHLQEVGLTLLHVKSDVGDHYTVRTLK